MQSSLFLGGALSKIAFIGLVFLHGHGCHALDLQSTNGGGASRSKPFSRQIVKNGGGFFSRKPDAGTAAYHLQKLASEKAHIRKEVKSQGGVVQVVRPDDNNNNKKKGVKSTASLILVRHGESVESTTASSVNKQLFVGWSDPDLTSRGVWQMEHAARLLRESGYEMDVVFSSRLQRAIHSSWVILRELDEQYLPVFKSWRLNERSYGALTGYSKADVAAEIGPQRVQDWRTKPYAVPPPLSKDHAQWPGKQRKYADVDIIPPSESYVNCTQRLAPLWEDILCELQVGHNVLVVGHGSTLRGMVQFIQGLTPEQACQKSIPPGCPLVYEFDSRHHQLKVIPTENKNSQSLGLWGRFLERPGLLQEAIDAEMEWRSVVPGFDHTSWADSKAGGPQTSLEKSLAVLRRERELEVQALGEKVRNDIHLDDDDDEDDDDDDATRSKVKTVAVTLPDGSQLRPFIIKGHPCLVSLPEGVQLPQGLALPARTTTVIVMIRHGKTEHNKLNLFTGWEDPPLAAEGVEEAKMAGKLLRDNGFEFDVVYSSWLQRAIETAWHVLDQLDTTWIPMVKSWRLNERMYGGLTGKSKAMIARIYGDKQFKTWRRGFKDPPPKVDVFSPYYPGNDRRYQKFMSDVRYSFTETLIRSVANKRFTPSRKFPKTESLHCCMKRTIPFLTDVIIPESVQQGKRVLIASSENAIRGMLMHLCEIPEELISQLNIPNGVPLIYDVPSRCLKLLAEVDPATGQEINPLEKYDFGPAAEYLFRSREVENSAAAEDEQCDVEHLSYEAMKALGDLVKADHQSLPADTVAQPQEPVELAPFSKSI